MEPEKEICLPGSYQTVVLSNVGVPKYKLIPKRKRSKRIHS